MILPAFRRNTQNRNIHALYGMIVAQARSVILYTAYGVPDTVVGRFELIVLHLVLVLRRLGRTEGAGPSSGSQPNAAGLLGQQLFDLFCRDLDGNLREIGVGDLAVPRKMRHFGEAFYDRQAAYRAGLAAAGERELEKALSRNIFGLAGVDNDGRRLRVIRALRQANWTPSKIGLLPQAKRSSQPEAFSHD